MTATVSNWIFERSEEPMSYDDQYVIEGRDELLTIADALNAQAKALQDLAENRASAPQASREIWMRKAEDNRALTRKLLGEDDAEAAEWGRRAGASGIKTSPYERGSAQHAVWRHARTAEIERRALGSAKRKDAT